MTFAEKILEAAQEGIVLLKNEGAIPALPLNENETVSVFGRGQFEFLKCGLGSGGSVHAPYSTNLIDNLPNANRALAEKYKAWLKENPYDNGGGGWAAEPTFQKEMQITPSLAKDAAAVSKKAIVVIMRNAGEDKDLKPAKGGWYLTDTESENIKNICAVFEQVIIVFNVGGIIDTSWVNDASFGGKISAVLYAWQGGQETGRAAANILLGKAVPCGKLTDTIARSIDDYPSTKDFTASLDSYYNEDIFVGYRYFNTFAKEKILYPFGFGISYTNFETKFSAANFDGQKVSVNATVKNTGNFNGKEVVQIYMESPQGKLGKPARVLAAFKKTSLLKPQEEEAISLSFEINALASYDDSGATGNKSCKVLEAGKYFIYAGTDVSSATRINVGKSDSIKIESDIVVEKLTPALAPTAEYKRIKVGALQSSGNYKVEWENTPRRDYDLAKRIQQNLPQEIAFTGNKGIKFLDVCRDINLLDNFVAQLNDEELATLVRGEGMCSRKVTPGVASAFGGVSNALYEYGIPVAATADGPSGVRMDTGKEASLMPIGTQLACSWNVPLVEELMALEGEEIRANNVDTILGPGINIHRNPLGGRNFEYFSEDPLITSAMTVATIKGIAKSGADFGNAAGGTNSAHATIKHFLANNRETDRRQNNSILSERAAREIYLPAFEAAVKEGNVQSIMTSYNLVNGIQCASNHDLCVSVLRNDWHYEGLVMTDWWAIMNDCVKGGESSVQQVAAMVRSRNDVYMITENDLAEKDGNNDDIKASLKNGTLTKAELQVCAKDVIKFLTKSLVAKRPLRALDDVPTFNAKLNAAPNGKSAILEDVKFMINGKTSDFIQVDEDAVYNFMALFSKPDDGTVSQSVCNIKIDGQNALAFDSRTTNGIRVGVLVGLVKLTKGVYEISIEHTKPGIEIAFLGFSRHISTPTGIQLFRNEGEPPEMSMPRFMRDKDKDKEN